MKEVFKNEWIITIISAIISGTILIPISIKLENFLNNSKIKKETIKTNREVVGILRKIISEKEAITHERISLISDAVARKNNIDLKNVNTQQMMIEDLILDVLDTSYISMLKKVEIVEKLENLINSKRVERNTYKHNSETSSFFLVPMFLLLLIIISIPIILAFVKSGFQQPFVSNLYYLLKYSPAFIAFLMVSFNIYYRLKFKCWFINTTTIRSFFGFSDEDDNYFENHRNRND